MKTISRLALLALCAALAACSVLEESRVDYKSATKGPSLDVPPDLTQLMRDTIRYQVPGSGPVSAVGMQAATRSAPAGTPVASNAVGEVRLERSGDRRWLVLQRAPDTQLWQSLRDFWKDNGFTLRTDQAELGVMETDWAENRANIPQDVIRRTLGKVLDNVYDSGTRDRYRTRVERGAGNTTEIYIAHRGMEDYYTSGTARDSTTAWRPRPSDPELENQFLRRLMLRLGASQEQAAAATASASQTAAAPARTSRVATVDGRTVVQIDDGFDRAWRRVGLALDRSGFTVEDRDRSQGLYFVRYVPADTGNKDKGFFGRLFSRDTGSPPVKLRVAVRSAGESTTVSVLTEQGTPDSSDNGKRIVQLLADDLK